VQPISAAEPFRRIANVRFATPEFRRPPIEADKHTCPVAGISRSWEQVPKLIWEKKKALVEEVWPQRDDIRRRFERVHHSSYKICQGNTPVGAAEIGVTAPSKHHEQYCSNRLKR
jgi:hypothetical protein